MGNISINLPPNEHGDAYKSANSGSAASKIDYFYNAYTNAANELNELQTAYTNAVNELNELQTAYNNLQAEYDEYKSTYTGEGGNVSDEELQELNTRIEELESYILDIVSSQNALLDLYNSTCDTLIADTTQVYYITEDNDTKEYSVVGKINYGKVESDDTVTITSKPTETDEETSEEINLSYTNGYVILTDNNDNNPDVIVLPFNMSVDDETNNDVYLLQEDGTVALADPARTVIVSNTNTQPDEPVTEASISLSEEAVTLSTNRDGVIIAAQRPSGINGTLVADEGITITDVTIADKGGIEGDNIVWTKNRASGAGSAFGSAENMEIRYGRKVVNTNSGLEVANTALSDTEITFGISVGNEWTNEIFTLTDIATVVLNVTLSDETIVPVRILIRPREE